MPVVLKNNASNSLAAAITSTDTGIVVRNGNLFPALAAGQYFYATITGADGSQEIVKVTARSGNGMTIVRAQEGTFALPFQLDSRFEMRITAATIADILAEDDLAATVTIADAGGYYTGGTVEAALQEVGSILTTVPVARGGTAATTADNALVNLAAQKKFAQVRKDVATLLADTTITYTAGTVNSVSTGDVVQTATEGFAYTVAASGASDQHVTTAGGVKLYVLPGATGYNVKAFGAKGDGVTNDTVAIQSAVTNCPVIFVPDGTFIAKNISIPADRVIFGTGTLKLPVCPSLDFSPIIRMAGNSLKVCGLSFDGNRNSQPADGFSDSFNSGSNGRGRSNRCAILANAVLSGLVVENCSFTNLWGASIATQDVSDIFVSGCTFYSNNFEGVYAYSSDTTAQEVLSVTNCRFETIGSSDASVNANCILASRYNSVIVTGCFATTFERNFVKLEVCNAANVSGNDISSNLLTDFNCIQAQSGGNDISFLNNNIRNVKRGVLVSSGSFKNVNISGNRFVNISTSGSVVDAITVEGCENLSICDNIFNEVDRYYAYVAGDSKFVKIMGNIGVNTTNENNAAFFIQCSSGQTMRMLSVIGNVLSGKQSSNDGVIAVVGSGTIDALLISQNVIKGASAANNRGIWGQTPVVTGGIVSHNVGGTDCNIEFYVSAGSSVEATRNAVPRVIGLSNSMSRSLPPASAAPTTGTYYTGDVIFHSSPAAGGNIGFVCTSGGTPGTWKTFGAIAV